MGYGRSLGEIKVGARIAPSKSILKVIFMPGTKKKCLKIDFKHFGKHCWVTRLSSKPKMEVGIT